MVRASGVGPRICTISWPTTEALVIRAWVLLADTAWRRCVHKVGTLDGLQLSERVLLTGLTALGRRSIYFGYLGCSTASLPIQLLLGVTSVFKKFLLAVTILREDTLHLAMLVNMSALVTLSLGVDRGRLGRWVALCHTHVALSRLPKLVRRLMKVGP